MTEYNMIASEKGINLDMIIKEHGEVAAREWIESLTAEEMFFLSTDPFFNLREKQIIDSEDNRDKRWGTLLLPGRALCPETPILTTEGFIRFGDIKVGDKVFDETGNPCNVTEIHHQGTVEAYRFTFSSGEVIDACEDHKWYTATSCTGGTIKTTKQVVESFEQSHVIPYIGEDFTIGSEHYNGHVIDVVEYLGSVEGYLCITVDSPSHLFLVGHRLIPTHNSFGKAVKNQTLIPTPSGFTTMGDIKVGDNVLDETGNPTKVLSVHPQGAVEAYEIEFSTGEIVEACGDHLWFTFTPNKSGRVLKTKHILDTLHLNHYIPKAGTPGFVADIDSPGTHIIKDIRPLGIQDSGTYTCITVDSPNSLFLCTGSFIPTHNTYSLSAWTIRNAVLGKGPIALVGTTAGDVRDVMVEAGDSSIMALCPKRFMPVYKPSIRRLVFPNGVLAFTYSAQEPGLLRGPQHQRAVVDELARFEQAEAVMSNLSMGMRIGDPYTVAATTPLPIDIIRRMHDDLSWKKVRGSTFENVSIPETFVAQMKKDYEGTSLGRQEIHGEILWESDYALWRREFIDPYRVLTHPTSFHNIVIALDPTFGGGERKHDDFGLIVACSNYVGEDLHAYILEDCTTKGTPVEWANATRLLLDKYPMATVVVESNAGGTMITEVLTKYGIPSGKIELKHHIKSKYDRAKPVAFFAERGMIHHCDMFNDLEDELCSYSGSNKDKSPNRLDALVIAVHSLLINKRALWVQSTF